MRRNSSTTEKKMKSLQHAFQNYADFKQSQHLKTSKLAELGQSNLPSIDFAKRPKNFKKYSMKKDFEMNSLSSLSKQPKYQGDYDSNKELQHIASIKNKAAFKRNLGLNPPNVDNSRIIPTKSKMSKQKK